MKTPVQPLTGANQLTEPKPEPSPGSTTPKGTLSRTNTDTVTAKYPASQAPFKRFTYYFIPVPPEKNFTIFDLQTTHKLDKAKTRGIPSTIVNFNGRKHIFDLETCTYHPESDPKFVKNFQIVRRPEQWYYQDVDGTIQPYDPETNFKIFSGKENGLEIIPDVKIGHHEYEINLKEMKQRNKKTSTERIIYSESVITSMKNWPVFIDKKTKVPEGETTMIRQLNENEPEYKKVEAYFRMNMASFILKKERTLTGSKTELIPTNKITKIEKIVNPKLREQWEFLLEKIKRDNNDNNKNIEYTKLLWHGSGTLPPPVIYQDVHYGWKINYSSAKNLWGPGLYFGEDAQYCHKYVYRTGGRRQIFLAEVIIGDDIISLEDDTIREPWMKDDGKTRYDSVCGVRHEKSWIWVVYASGRAYPCYLLEYED
uniref:Poly [ADP-ribose] polymerase n=1 Tax=Arcella intermedia TaxID=1963864 RepID=A0A6B2L0Q2_9EUKA